MELGAFFIAVFAATLASGAVFIIRNLTNRLLAYLLKLEEVKQKLNQ